MGGGQMMESPSDGRGATIEGTIVARRRLKVEVGENQRSVMHSLPNGVFLVGAGLAAGAVSFLSGLVRR